MISSRQINKRGSIAVLPALFFMLLTGLCSSISYAAWENVSGVTIEQGQRVYERSTRTYYTFNTLTNQSGSDLQGSLRFLVTSASHPILNADGVEAGDEYYDVLSVDGSLADGQSLAPVRFNFQRIRGAFAYTVVLQREVLDTDDDGIPDSEDLCPNDATNLCMSINGQVNGGGAALDGASIKIGLNSVNAASIGNGSFTANVGPEEFASDNINTFFPVEVIAPGFATGHGKVIYVNGTNSYDFLINLEPISTTIDPENDDVTVGVDINKEGAKVGTLLIPAEALPTGVTSVSGEVTYLDPTTDDLESTPGGDLLALPEGTDPNDTPVPLESFGMMEFNLADQNGNPIHELPAAAEVCMQAGAGLSEGDTVPLWWFNTANGLWEEEGEGTVVDRDGQLQICGAVTHFTWWNYDHPVSEHACFKYHMVSDQTDPINTSLTSSFVWRSEGVTYNGVSPERATDRDANDPLTPLPNDKIDSLTVKRSIGANIEQNRVYTYIAGTKVYLKRDGEEQYSLTADQTMAAVFDDPTASGSGLRNVNVQNCQFLDYMDAAPDGILEIVTTYNLPPVISQFSAVSDSIFPGNATTINATITDPEGGAVSSSWSASCFSSFGAGSEDETIAPLSETKTSGSVFSPIFTAPTTMAGPYENCQVILQATDGQGATATAEYWVNVVVENFIFVAQGIVYGVDGLPLLGTQVQLVDYNCGNSYTETTDINGQYSINIDLCPGTQPEDFRGQFETTYIHPNDISMTTWVQTNHVENNEFRDFRVENIQIVPFPPFAGSCEYTPPSNNILTCQEDIHLPVLWGELSGDLHAPVLNLPILSIEHKSGRFDFEIPDTNRAIGFYGTSSYSLLVPVGGISRIMGLEEEVGVPYSMPNTNGMRLDLGNYNVNLHINILDNVGLPLSGAQVNYFSEYSEGASVGITDAAGELNLLSLSVPASNLGFQYQGSEMLNGYNAYAVAHYNGEDIYATINSQEQCSVVLRVYDEQRNIKVNELINVYVDNNSFSGYTDNNGEFFFTAPAGSIIEEGLGGFFYGDYWSPQQGVLIGNCPRDEFDNPEDILLEWVQGEDEIFFPS